MPLQQAVDEGKNAEEKDRCQVSIQYCDEEEGDGMFPMLGVGEDTLFLCQN